MQVRQLPGHLNDLTAKCRDLDLRPYLIVHIASTRSERVKIQANYEPIDNQPPPGVDVSKHCLLGWRNAKFTEEDSGHTVGENNITHSIDSVQLRYVLNTSLKHKTTPEVSVNDFQDSFTLRRYTCRRAF